MLRRWLDNIKFDFVGYRRLACAFSVVICLGSLALVGTRGLNFGIDFRGGIAMEVGAATAFDVPGLRRDLAALNLGDISIQEFGGANQLLIRVQQQEVKGEETAQADARQQQAVQQVKAALGSQVEFRRVEVVGPTVGGELINTSLIALTLSTLGILFYIWFRFEWQFGIGVVMALLHDVVATLGVFAITQMDFSLPTVAAILTVAGYSINDTVIVYDRIRENLRKYKKMPLLELLNRSLNETFSRTLFTSVSTLLALFSLYFFGGEVIASFTVALIWGILVGTYSSWFIAAPLLLQLKLRRGE